MIKLCFSAIVGILGLSFFTPVAHSSIIESATDDISNASKLDIQGCGKISTVSTPVRAGNKAQKHLVPKCSERAEVGFKKTEIGKTYWLGWSMYFPSNFDSSKHFTVISQWSAGPTEKPASAFPCGGIGHKLSVHQNNEMRYDLQHQSSGKAKCEKFIVGNISQVKGKWIDLIQQVKWTGNQDGFLNLWMRVGGGQYKQIIAYKGATWWNDEGTGPYFKVGPYLGKGNAGKWVGNDVVMYSDEYRLGDTNSSMIQVSPIGVGE